MGTALRYQRFSRRNRRWVLIGLGGLIGLSALWIVVTGYFARQQAAELATRIQQVRVLVAQGRVADARRLGHDIPSMAERTQRLTTGPAWWTAAHVPFLGRPVASSRDIAAAIGEVGQDAVPKLLTVAADVDPSQLRTNGHTVRLAPLVRAEPDLRAAAAVLDHGVRRLSGTPSSIGLIDVRRAELLEQLQAVRGYVDAAQRVARVLPTMLGQDGTRRYFIGLQNEAEMRGTGGLPGAFAIARVTNGSVTFERFESDSVLLPAKTKQKIDTGLNFGNDYNELYAGSEPTTSYIDSNVSPDFRYAAQIWAAMWTKVSGQRIDGVIALDPTTLGYLLGATGPADVKGYGGSITAANVVSLTQSDEYVLFPDNNQRKRFNVAVLRAAANKVTSGAGNAIDLVRAASASSQQQRFLVWYRDPAVEAQIDQSNYGGVLPASRRPFSAAIVNNAAAGKLDYYLHRSVDYVRTGCGARRDVVVTITLTNDAPASGLPPYVTTRLDSHRPRNVRPGDNRVLLDYFGTSGGVLRSVTINGKDSVASVQSVFGLTAYRLDVELPRGTSRTIVLHVDEPPGQGAPRIWRQPGVNPIDVQVFNQACG